MKEKIGLGQLIGLTAAVLLVAMIGPTLYTVVELVAFSEALRAGTASGDAAAAQLLFFATQVAIMVLWVLGLTVMGSAYAASHAARPLRDLARRMEAIGRGVFSERISLEGLREYRDISRITNEMAEALSAREQRLVHTERLANLGTLVAGVAHEINNPLTFMRGNTELLIMDLEERLARPDLSPEDRRFFEEALQGQRTNVGGFDQLGGLSASLKAVGRASSGARGFEDVNRLVNGCLVLAHAKFKSGLRVDLDLRASRRVLCNSGEISQVLLNLILNAAEAMGEEGLLALGTADEADHVVVRVQDNGPGIPESLRDRIFQPFSTTKEKGTGLGLALSRRIVESHGGSIAFESSPGKGATFFVRLPTVCPSHRPGASPEAQARA